jgi:hypothetical protein
LNPFVPPQKNIFKFLFWDRQNFDCQRIVYTKSIKFIQEVCMFAVLEASIARVIRALISIISFGGLFIPGRWIFEFLGLIALILLGAAIFNEPDNRCKFFWKSMSVLSVLEMIRILTF